MKKILLLGLAALFTCSVSAADNELVAKMSVYSVDQAKGQEQLTEAKEAVNGDLLEYQIVYTNTSDKTFSDLSIVGKIPSTTTFVKGSANIENGIVVFYSADLGATWSEKPMIKEIVNGQIIEKEAAITDYNRIKWTVDTLEPKKEKVFKYRVLVNEY